MSVPERNLADFVDSFPEPWLHEPGDRLIGEIIELDTAKNDYGPYQLVTVLVTESASTERGGKAIPVGSVRVWHAFDTVPANELKKRAPRVGDRIAVKDFGVRDGKHYNAYRIIVQRKTPTAGDEDATPPRADGLCRKGTPQKVQHRPQPLPRAQQNRRTMTRPRCSPRAPPSRRRRWKARLPSTGKLLQRRWKSRGCSLRPSPATSRPQSHPPTTRHPLTAVATSTDRTTE
jgi:hypothetical protein